MERCLFLSNFLSETDKIVSYVQVIISGTPSMDLATSEAEQSYPPWSWMVQDSPTVCAQPWQGEEGAGGNTYYSITRIMSFLDSKAS